MDNLNIYNKVRKVPPEALKPITGGRLKGKSDINPMWRIKTLTELFGVCGTGWKYEIIEKRLEQGANGEIAAFVDINLYIKLDNRWGEAIPGTGGSAFVAKETSGLYTNDECFKMALTDAISVACKALGVGADVYWDKDSTKYTKPEKQQEKPKKQESPEEDPEKKLKGLNREQAAELITISTEKWGDGAARCFCDHTGYKQPKFVPAAEFENVKKIIEEALPF